MIDLFWRAPEELRGPQKRGSSKGDVYAFGIILHEMFGRCGPFGFCNMVPKGRVYMYSIITWNVYIPDFFRRTCRKINFIATKKRILITDIVYRVIDGGLLPFRPDTSGLKCEKYVVDCMESCWREAPEDRPDFRCIYKSLQKIREGMYVSR